MARMKTEQAAAAAADGSDAGFEKETDKSQINAQLRKDVKVMLKGAGGGLVYNCKNNTTLQKVDKSLNINKEELYIKKKKKKKKKGRDNRCSYGS